MQPMKSRVRSIVFPLLAAFIWGIAFVAQKGNTTGPFTFNACRGIIAFVFLLPVILIFSHSDCRHILRGNTPEETRTLWIGGICCGVVLTTAAFLQQYGLDGTTEAGKGGFLTALYIVIVPILGLLLRKKVPPTVWISLVIAVVGLYFLCIRPDSSLSLQPDDLLILSSSLVYAIHILTIDHFSPLVDGIKLSCIQFLTQFVVSGAAALIFENPSWASIRPCLGAIIYLGIMSSGVAYTLQIIAQKDTNPTVLSLLLSMESVFSVLAGAVILGEVLAGREYLGCILMLAAVVLAQIPAPQRKRAAKASEAADSEAYCEGTASPNASELAATSAPADPNPQEA